VSATETTVPQSGEELPATGGFSKLLLIIGLILLLTGAMRVSFGRRG
jgi:LPXTG-motif cell wall-anchored protein